MKELKEVNEKLKTSENAVAELRQMRRELTVFYINNLCCICVSYQLVVLRIVRKWNMCRKDKM